MNGNDLMDSENVDKGPQSFFKYISATTLLHKGVIYAVTIFLMALGIKLFVLSFEKLKKIRSRDLRRNNVEHDTYSVFSIYIFRWVQVQLILVVLLAFSTLVLIILNEIDN